MPIVEVNGTALAYSDTGPAYGPPIVFSHSLFFDHTMFNTLGAFFSSLGFRAIAYDHRNQGGSARATRDRLDMDTLTEDAAALIEHLRLGRCHFVGNSMGGFVALRLAARRPDLLMTVSALGSSAEAEPRVEEYQSLLDVFDAQGPAPVLDVLMRTMFGDTSLASRPDVCRPWRAFMNQLHPSISHSAYCVIHRDGIVEELADCRVPVLAIAGSEDHTYPQPMSGRTIASASGGTQVTVARAGHSVALEQPDPVARHLIEHFSAGPEIASSELIHRSTQRRDAKTTGGAHL